MKTRILGLLIIVVASAALVLPQQDSNLFKNSDLLARDAKGVPDGFQLAGDVTYEHMGNARATMAGWGVGLKSARHADGAEATGAISQTISGIDFSAGKWFRLTFRGLPQENFNVLQNDLYMKVEFFGDNGKVSYDEKARKIYDQVLAARRDLTVNGVQHLHGAEAWRTYQLDFCLPFPQVNQLRISVGFDHGISSKPAESEFLLTDFSLVRIPDPPAADAAPTPPSAIVPVGKLMPIGGRWFYMARADESQIPKMFDGSNMDRLLYHDTVYSAPFANNTSAWMRAGFKDLRGAVVARDTLIMDNVTVTFDAAHLIVHSRGLPNHPTGRFPAQGFGDPNPNYIQEQQETFYIPLNPAENPNHVSTAKDNSNHALPMGPIGVAVNGVVFFNPFDADSQDAADLMDLCCGHPSPGNLYHYHKYPICINSPWADEGKEHSPLLGFAFDGYPIYGPYEDKDEMAKDLAGDRTLNAFNMHYDKERGWHYHVTPGKFPYIIGGYWGTEDPQDVQGPGRRGMGGPGGRGPRGGPGAPNGPPPF